MDWKLASRWLHPWRIQANQSETRDLFSLRDLVNYSIAILFFVSLLLLLLALDPFYIFANLVAFGLVYYLYFSFLKRRVIWTRCESCQKPIETNKPWVCGQCGYENKNSVDYPFVNCCEDCGDEPKVYRCHHKDCNQFIFLTIDKDPTHCAYRLDASLKLEEAKTVAATEKKMREEIAILKHKREKASIEFQIRNLETIEEVKTAFDEMMSWMIKEFDRAVAVEETIRLLNSKIAERFPGKENATMRKNLQDFVNDLAMRAQDKIRE